MNCILAGAWLPQKYASPYLCYSVKFGHSNLNCTSVIKEICHQILALPLNNKQPGIVTKGHWNPRISLGYHTT